MIQEYGLRGMRVAVIGAAREGLALARFMSLQGAQVTLSDAKSAEALSDALAELAGLPVRLALGGHPADLLDVDVLFLSPGVPLGAPLVQEARRRGVPLSSEPRLFTQLCQAPVVGITGSSGKTTTTTLVGRMLKAAGRRTWVGGNIGRPLIGELLGGEQPDVAVMELSSFQLELFHAACQGEQTELVRSEASRAISLAGWSPPIAVVTNITPNHLDRHASMEDYVHAKAAILDYQGPADWAILNGDDAYAARLAARARGQVARFSLAGPVACGAMLRGDELWLRLGGREEPICARGELRLRGEHNVANVLAAGCAAALAGAGAEAIRSVATTFEGVPHRLEVVRRWRGVTFVNDSIATSPERAIAALRAFDEPLVLLAGGRDKHLPWDEWAAWVRRKVRVVVAFGECAPLIEKALAGGPDGPLVRRADDLGEAVGLAAQLAQAGEVALLSPGGTSFDAYVDFEARGRAFRDLVHQL
jgi:UDP-N-acetylmuramoylalanine--D-glutamate ligase